MNHRHHHHHHHHHHQPVLSPSFIPHSPLTHIYPLATPFVCMPSFTGKVYKSVHYDEVFRNVPELVACFKLDMTDEEAGHEMQRIIQISTGAMWMQVWEASHAVANLIR